MEKPIIEVRSISKSYFITKNTEYYVSLRDVFTNIAKSPFSFLGSKAKEIIGKEKKEIFWALKNVSTSIKKGEIVGVIGANGAGKSTLLKILNKITDPTSGEIIIRGKISSLLEVGTGFHPELTGRENIYFSGAILGMKRKEIKDKFEDIVKFAEMEQFLDVPVKRYSSGMHVRLAFSVAAHMEPDILLIDEVLAVGDASFQKKCLEKIHQVARKDGRTIIFVSHNLDVVQSICDRAIYIDRGEVRMTGQTSEVVRFYLENQAKIDNSSVKQFNLDDTKDYQIRQISLKDKHGATSTLFEAGYPFSVEVDYSVKTDKSVFWIVLQCINENGTIIFSCRDTDKNPNLMTSRSKGEYVTTFDFPANYDISLSEGNYILRAYIEQDPTIEATLSLQIVDTTRKFGHHPGVLMIGTAWKNSVK